MVNLKNSNDLSLSNSNSSLNSIDTTYVKDQPERTVYLGDLDMDINEKQISEFFASLNIPLLKIVKQAHSSFAHVTFKNANIAKYLLEQAVLSLNNKLIRVMPFNQPTNFDPDANLIIKNLESHLNESHIIQKFKPFGDILSCKLVRDDRGESKCYAYLQFKDKTSAMNAIDKLNNQYWDERCDPDFKYKKYQEKLCLLRKNHLVGKLNESDLQESELFADFNNKMGKKLYVGIFKKKDEYSKIKSDKEGKLSNLYVKNFGTSFGDRDLFNLFKAYGSIKSAKVRRLKCGLVEKPLGCGFVDFENPEEAENARKSLDGYMLENGRTISVTYADCKSRRARKKLEENENNHKQISHESNCNFNVRNDRLADVQEEIRQEHQNEQKLNESTINYSNNTYNNNNNNQLDLVHITISDDMERRNRKISVCSDSSNESSLFSSSCSPSPHLSPSSTVSSSVSSLVMNDWENVWSRLLHTSNWTEYKLFDGINLF